MTAENVDNDDHDAKRKPLGQSLLLGWVSKMHVRKVDIYECKKAGQRGDRTQDLRVT
jgi:hypothetical protein